MKQIKSFPGAIDMIKSLDGTMTDQCIADELTKKYNYNFTVLSVRRVRRRYIRGDDSLPPSQKNNKATEKEIKARQAITKIAPAKTKCCLCETRDGLVYHHPDYDRPTWVAIVCRSCHAAIHKHNELDLLTHEFAREYGEDSSWKDVLVVSEGRVIKCSPLVLEESNGIIRLIGKIT